MVYGFIKEMKGHIKVMSEVGQGTTFTLFFPRAAQLQKIAAPALAPADDLVPARKHKTILVVDDDDLVRKSVITQINSLGYGTIEASGSAEALEIISSPEFFRSSVFRHRHAGPDRWRGACASGARAAARPEGHALLRVP